METEKSLFSSGELEKKVDFKEKILNPEISHFLDEIRKTDLPFYKKAEKFEKFLLENGCQEVVRCACDVCVEEYSSFGKTFDETIKGVLDKNNINKLAEEDEQDFAEKVDRNLPEESKTRVQAETPSGYLTYCFDCDSTMCMNETEYNNNPNWDKNHLGIVKDFILKHPEFEITYYKTSGSTRRYICIDALVENIERADDFQEFDLPNGQKIKISFNTIQQINSYGENYVNKTLKSYFKV